MPQREVEDVTADCLAAAWAAIQRGDFRVHAWVDPVEALRRWLYGIAWRLSAHERDRARHRREVLVDAPWDFAREEPALDAEAQLRARVILRALDALPETQRALLLATAEGATPSELSAPLRVTPRAVLHQLSRARRALLVAARVE
ncbi:RNA polymerase sigma factor [Chondromyces crocatus]|uniref:RNA polymerase sigma factor n=1 Tax=Chondromyces crocatus TaxID=52 RepID=UPI0012E1DEC8|nr:sigma factor-like helix-turn-helix DNA-binding protein [Chondromyces crocatus]